MTQEPLWASSLATLPRSDEDERLAEPRPPREPERPEPEPPAPARYGRAVPVVLVAGLAAVALSLADTGSPVEVSDVPSSWGDTQMRCDTARFTRGPRALEVFECRASDGGALPTGRYTSPRTVWNSDIDERQALMNRIRIEDGVVRGWARY